jgi:hypothetical protein
MSVLKSVEIFFSPFSRGIDNSEVDSLDVVGMSACSAGVCGGRIIVGQSSAYYDYALVGISEEDALAFVRLLNSQKGCAAKVV